MLQTEQAVPVSHLLAAAFRIGERSFTPSQYLWVYRQRSGTVFLVNLLNHVVIALTAYEFDSLQRMHGSPPEFYNQELLSLMVTNQFLFDAAEVDEASLLEERYNTIFNEAVNFGVTFGLTMKCNFDCTYCYQTSPMGRMAKGTLLRI